jgi:hypothetical protein
MAGGTPGGTVVTTPPGSTAEALSDRFGAHMSEHKTLLQFLLDLLNNKDALADFQRDPQGALHAAGLQNVCVDDIKDLMPVVLEKVDPQKCAQYEDDCDHGRDHDDAPRHHGDHHHHDGGHHDDHGWSDHDNEIDKVVTHLNYVTNNYSFDSHDTIYNTNNITKIWADHGANVDVNNETHNVGAGGVDVEGDNNAPIATGGHNQIGNGNEQSGDGSTTSFGSGAAQSHVSASDGGAVSGNGAASGDSEHFNAQAFGGGNVTAATHAPATSSTTDSHDHTTTTTDSNNHTSTDSHDLTNSQNDTDNSSHLDTSHSGNTFSATDDSQHLNVHDNSVDLTAVHH